MVPNTGALGVGQQEAEVQSLSNLYLQKEKIEPDVNGAIVKTSANVEKTDEEKEDRAALSLKEWIRSYLVINKQTNKQATCP